MNPNLRALIQEIICLRNDRAYAINLVEYKSMGFYWILFHVNNDNLGASYDATFDSFGVERVGKEI